VPTSSESQQTISLDDKKRPQKRTVETRLKLLGAAIDVFSSVGYDGARTRDIEDRAGVKRGLLAYHFDAKDGLWRAAVDHLFEAMKAEFAKASEYLNDLEAQSRGRFLVRTLVRITAKYPQLNRIMIQEGIQKTWRLEWLVEHHARPFFEYSKSIHQEALASGMKSDIDHAHFYYILMGASSLIWSMGTEYQMFTGEDAYSKETIDQHAEAVVTALFGPPESADLTDTGKG